MVVAQAKFYYGNLNSWIVRSLELELAARRGGFRESSPNLGF
ncbi:hypothetical protein [Nostoc sp.]